MALSRRERALLVALGAVGLLYAFSRTKTGASVVDAVTEKIAALLTGEEGERLTVYQDQAGLWTIGKGHLIKPGERFYPYGTVKTITKAESDALFEADTASARNAVANLVMVPLSENQRAALVSLVFNIGNGAFAGSTLLKLLNARDYLGAAGQFPVWNKVTINGAKTVSAGLTARRDREKSLFLS